MKVILQKHSWLYSLNKTLLLTKNLKSFHRLKRRLCFELKKFKYLTLGIWTEQNFTVTSSWRRTSRLRILASSRDGVKRSLVFTKRHFSFCRPIPTTASSWVAFYNGNSVKKVLLCCRVLKGTFTTNKNYLQTELGSKWCLPNVCRVAGDKV